MAQLAFIGTGTMGAPMAEHLLSSGHVLRVHDRQPQATRELVARGAVAASSPADAADGCDCVFLSLPGPSEVEAAVTGHQGVLGADTMPALVIDLSTNSVDTVRALAEKCSSDGVSFVDAPVSGGREKAESGSLSIMLGATDEQYETALPYLEIIGDDIFHVGPVGAGTIVKLVNNQLFLAAGVAVQEAYLLASAAGMDPADLHPILKASSAGPYARLAPLLLGRAFDDVVFRLDIAAKDLALAVETATDLGLELPTSEAALGVYRAALDAGVGQEAFHATIKVLEGGGDREVAALTRRPRSP